MPGMDGFELLRLVHATRPGLPTILITGYPDTLKRLPPLGGINPRFFTKPFQGQELLTAVSDALGRSRD
jgi:DNA-binding NtrC family response regulator